MKNEGLKWLRGDLTVEKNKQQHLLAVLSVVCEFWKFWWWESELEQITEPRQGIYLLGTNLDLWTITRMSFCNFPSVSCLFLSLLTGQWYHLAQLEFSIWCPAEQTSLFWVDVGRKAESLCKSRKWPHSVLFIFRVRWWIRIKQNWRILSFFVLSFSWVFVRAPV